MRRHWAKRIFLFIVFAPLAIALFGFVVMHLWNWLAVAVFGWRVITFWQAVGILLLARILVGRFPGPAGPGHVLAAQNDGALGTNDARRAREIPPGHARPLRARLNAAARNGTKSVTSGVNGNAGLVVVCAAEDIGGVRQEIGDGVERFDGALGAAGKIHDQTFRAYAGHGARRESRAD